MWLGGSVPRHWKKRGQNHNFLVENVVISLLFDAVHADRCALPFLGAWPSLERTQQHRYTHDRFINKYFHKFNFTCKVQWAIYQTLFRDTPFAYCFFSVWLMGYPSHEHTDEHSTFLKAKDWPPWTPLLMHFDPWFYFSKAKDWSLRIKWRWFK